MTAVEHKAGLDPCKRLQREGFEVTFLPVDRFGRVSPEQVAEKLLFEHELFGHQRYVAQMSVGAVAHSDVMRSLELFGTEVAPRVRAEVARREALQPSPA